MKTRIALALFITSTLAMAQLSQEQTINLIAQSHIEANVPEPKDFDQLLRRDVTTYLTERAIGPFELQYEMLREGATQTGVAYPKFYIWVRAVSADKPAITEGAMRLAAVNKTAFHVTDFVTKSEITKNPKILESVFPKALLQKIRAKAGVAD